MPEMLPNDQYNQQLIANVHPPDWENPIPNETYNLLVIGAGSAGLVAAVGAASLGAKVALVEKNLLGGDCLNTGCVPSKAIISSARFMGDLQRAPDLGWQIPDGIAADFGKVMERMRQIRAAISVHDSAQRMTGLGIDLFLGSCQFSSLNTAEVDGKTIRFKKALIATGARPAELPIPGLKETGYLTNETVFELTQRPSRLAIIGAGPIGAELAQTFARLGTDVHLFDILPQILGREDEDAATIVKAALEKDGVHIHLNSSISQIEGSNLGKKIVYQQNNEQQTILVNEILLAAGRQPNVEGLNLDQLGIEYDRKGVKVNDFLQTKQKHIYAAGDVALKYHFTHVAGNSAAVVVQNALFFPTKKFSSLTIPWVTYTDPEVAHVGLYPEEATSKGISTTTYMSDLIEADRAQTDGETEGFVKIHVKKGTGEIVGATVVARHAGEMINELTIAIDKKIGLGALSGIIHPYPTQAEAIRQTAAKYNKERLTPQRKSWLEYYFRWLRS